MTFVEDRGVTTATTVIDYRVEGGSRGGGGDVRGRPGAGDRRFIGSKEARDAAAATGMTRGMEQSCRLLDRVSSERPADEQSKGCAVR